MNGLDESIRIDSGHCIGCVDCAKACPARAIRIRNGVAVVKDALCIHCGACVRSCRHKAARVVTSSHADLKRFKHTVALPSLTLYAQFGRDVHPAQVLEALKTVGFDTTYDVSWMCEMLAGATDAYLAECEGPWPKISITCPAIVRLVQMRYPSMLPNLVPMETARELAAKLLRRKLSRDLSLAPEEIGIFFITPCSAMIHSITNPVGLERSHLDGAFSIAELYPRLLQAIKNGVEYDPEVSPVSNCGLLWAMAGGEIAGMRNQNTLTVRGVQDVSYVFDRIEAGKFQKVDFIEAYICPDGCVSGQLVIEGRYAAQRNIHDIARRLSGQRHVREEQVLSMLRERFFELEEEIPARPVQPLSRDLREAIARKRAEEAIVSRLPGKDCAACGSPDCATLARDIVQGEATINDCVFIQLEELQQQLQKREASAP